MARQHTKSKASSHPSIFFASPETSLPEGYQPFLYPQPGPQTELLIRPEMEILYGGARGGGKTVGGMIWLLKGNPDLPQSSPANVSYINHPQYRALVLRKYFDDLKDWIDRAQSYYCASHGSPLGAIYNAQAKVFTFPSGAKILCDHLKDEQAFHKYRGHQYHRILFEELTQIPSEELYLEVFSSCRSPQQELRPQLLSTTNPDGPGLDWVRKRFLYDPKSGLRLAPKTPILTRVRNPLGGFVTNSRIFLPATITDNPKLLESDPGYYARLRALSPTKQRAYIDGDWDALSGSQFFEDFRPDGPKYGEPPNASHCILRKDLHIQPWWWRGAAMDWGFNHPAMILLATKIEDGEAGGRMAVYKEIRRRRIGSYELGCEFAREILPDVMDTSLPALTIWVSHDAFDIRNADRHNSALSVVDMFREGIEYVLGKKACYVPQEVELGLLASEHEDSSRREYMEIRRKLEGARIIIRKAINARISGWEAIRKLLNWRGLPQNAATFDLEYGLRLLHHPDGDGARRYCDYWNSILRANAASMSLPGMWICRDTCPYLVDAIPRAIYDPSGEDVLKQDCNPETGLGGDDEIDCLRYLVRGFERSHSQEPRELKFRRLLAKTARAFGGEIPGHLIWQAQAQAQKALEKSESGRHAPARIPRLAARNAHPGSIRKGHGNPGTVWRGDGILQ